MFPCYRAKRSSSLKGDTMNRLFVLISLLVVTFLVFGSQPAQAECRDSRSQEECDLSILSQKLTEAGLPASPADIIGKAFCAGSGGGSSWCGTVIALTLDYRSWPGGNLHLRVDEVGSAPTTHAVFSFEEKKWRVSDRPVDWISVVTK